MQAMNALIRSTTIIAGLATGPRPCYAPSDSTEQACTQKHDTSQYAITHTHVIFSAARMEYVDHKQG